MDQLAKHIHGKYGKQWNSYIRKKNKDTSEITHSGIKPLQAPDIYKLQIYMAYFSNSFFHYIQQQNLFNLRLTT